MSHFLKRLITPLALLATVQIHSASAEGIRLIGPDGKVQSSPQYNQSIIQNRSTQQSQPANYYGPTGQNETLWSIATKLRPNTRLSVQQTLLAIYKLNPQAFADPPAIFSSQIWLSTEQSSIPQARPL